MFLEDYFDDNRFNSSRSSQATEDLRSMITTSAYKRSKANANLVLTEISGKI